MAGYEWYKKGTVILRNGEAEVVGANTEWLKDDIKQGDIFVVGNQVYEIAEVVGNTSLNLSKPYAGISDGAAEYAIITRAGEVLQAEVALALQEAIPKWNEYDAVVSELRERTQLMSELGLYVDGDGDLAQGEPGTTSGATSTTNALPIASATQLGGVKIGRNIGVTSDGTISTDIDTEVLQESFDKVATSPEDMNAMLDEVFSGTNTGS